MNKEIVEIKEIVSPILKKYNINYCGVFGSVARGEATEKSDIDLLIDCDNKDQFSLFSYLDLIYELSDALGKKVDLVRVKSIKPRVLPYIKKDLLQIYG